MRLKFTFILLGLNLLVFGSILYLGNRAHRAKESSTSLSAQIGREIIEADTIELRGSGLEQPRILKRTGSNWKITEPMEWKANYFAINRILNQLQFIEEEASFSIGEMSNTGLTLADYGLENPVVELTISDDRDSLQISIGTLTEIGDNVYLLGPDGERVYVVKREVIDGLLIELSDLRNREIFEIPVFEVNELGLQIRSNDQLNSGGLKVRLANTAGQWRFEAPLSAPADPALVSSTINTLASLKVGRFIEPNAGDPVLQGLENPFMRVTLHGNKRRQTLLIGNPAPGTPTGASAQYFARLEDNPIVFTVDAKPFESLMRAQESLRERNFMSFDRETLNAIFITEGEREIRLQRIERGGKDWQVLMSDGDGIIQPRRADPEVMEALITDLQELRAQAFTIDGPNNVDLGRLGFSTPRRVVTLRFDSGEPLRLELAHPEEENLRLYARTSEKASVYEVERRPTLQLVPLNSLHYRNRNIETLPQAAVIRRISLENLITGASPLRYEPDGTSNWAGLLETLNTDEADALSTLLGSLRRFDVKSYLSDGYAEAYPLDPDRVLPWAYKLSADILLPGGNTEQVRKVEYVFSERLSGTIQIGASRSHNSIFELEPELIEALYFFTEDLTLPPEAQGADVPGVQAPDPVGEPPSAPATEN